MDSFTTERGYSDPADAQSRYVNRELSWLSFNERVLSEARNPAYPLLERLRFLSISGSNLDEFMMIRVAGLAEQVRRGIDKQSIDWRTPSQQLSAIRSKVRELEAAQQAALRDLRKPLAEEGIAICQASDVEGAALRWLRTYFNDQIVPVITPQAIRPPAAPVGCVVKSSSAAWTTISA